MDGVLLTVGVFREGWTLGVEKCIQYIHVARSSFIKCQSMYSYQSTKYAAAQRLAGVCVCLTCGGLRRRSGLSGMVATTEFASFQPLSSSCLF